MTHIDFKKVAADPESEESHLIWEWRNDLQTRQMSRTKDLIGWETHKRWYQQKATDPHCQLLIASRLGVAIATVRFELIEEGLAEVNINLNPAFRGKNLAQLILSEACEHAFETMRLKAIYAEVKQNNLPSIKIFEGAGFILKEKKGDLFAYRLNR